MYPSETSLIPVTVALSRFAEKYINQNGWLATLSLGQEWYPYWYLGVPFRFLTGPVIPLTELLIHKTLPNISLFNITIYLVAVSFLLSAFGWGMVVQKLQNSKKFGIGHLAFVILLLVLPWRYFSALTMGEASFTIARNLLPFALLTIWHYLKKKDKISAVWGVIVVTFILLINTSILPIFAVGLTSVVLAKSFKEGKFRKLSKNIKLSLLPVACSLLLVTLVWYSPSYWWTLLTNPSIGGASSIKVILRIFDILRAGVPLFLAVVAVYFSGKVKRRITVFTLVWILTFGFLTLFRFIGDPDFWMDWTTWFYELEVGAALLIAQILNSKFQILNKSQISNFNVKNFTFYFLLLTALFILPFYFVWRIHLALGKPVLISQDIPEGIRSLEKLVEIADGQRVFLSGSTVFWVNALYDISQVRGGKDEASLNKNWQKGAYELREGTDPGLTKKWLDDLDITYILVHTSTSKEYYQDFRYIDKWDELGIKLYESDGDIIYKIK